MWNKILFNFIIWLIQQSWFQKAAIKLATSVVEKTTTPVDNKLLNFIIDHNDELLSIAQKELKKTESEVDERFVEALINVKNNKG